MTVPPESYLKAQRTPDGPMVTCHNAPDFRAITWPEVDYEWAEVTSGSVSLAEDMLYFAYGVEPEPGARDSFLRRVVKKLPPDGWVLTAAQIKELDETAEEDVF